MESSRESTPLPTARKGTPPLPAKNSVKLPEKKAFEKATPKVAKKIDLEPSAEEKKKAEEAKKAKSGPNSAKKSDG